MTEQLTYEEFCEQILKIAPELLEDLERFHGIDATAELENIKRQEYNEYLVSFLPGT